MGWKSCPELKPGSYYFSQHTLIVIALGLLRPARLQDHKFNFSLFFLLMRIPFLVSVNTNIYKFVIALVTIFLFFKYRKLNYFCFFIQINSIIASLIIFLYYLNIISNKCLRKERGNIYIYIR
jgi:hypothetical protein